MGDRLEELKAQLDTLEKENCDLWLVLNRFADDYNRLLVKYTGWPEEKKSHINLDADPPKVHPIFEAALASIRPRGET